MEIEHGNDSLGAWDMSEMDATRLEGNWFELRFGSEPWHFLPDDPTEFRFHAVPAIVERGQRSSRKRLNFDVRLPDMMAVGRAALGGLLGVFLVTSGLLMGRYRLDNSAAAVLVVLVVSAAIGAWWTELQRRDRESRTSEAADPKTVLTPRQKRSALSVSEVVESDRVRRAAASTTEAGADARAPSEPPPLTSVPASPAGAEEGTSESQRLPSEIGPTEEPLEGERPAVASSDDAIGPLPETPAEDDLSADDATSPSDATATAPEAAAVFDQSTLDAEVPPDTTDHTEPDHAELPPDTTDHTEEEVPGTAEKQRGTFDRSISVADLIEMTAGEEEPRELTTRVFVTDHPEGPPIDLTSIRGIGPAISKALGELGLTDVRDLAELEPEDLDYLERRLGRFAPVTRSTRWVSEARKIVTERSVDQSG